MANYQYCVATNWGKGFITHEDNIKLRHTGFLGNIWRVPANNQDSFKWINNVGGVLKTHAEAQAIVDVEVANAQAEWDAIPENDPRKQEGTPLYQRRPVAITLEE